MEFGVDFFGQVIGFLQLILVCILLIFKKKNLGENINYFIISIYLIFIPNFIGFSTKFFENSINSTPLFVVFVNFFGFLFFFIYYYKLLKQKKVKLLQAVVIIIFSIAYLVSALLIENFFLTFPTYFYFFQTLLLLVSITLFFYETFNSNLILNIKEYFPFWVSLSLIIIYVGLLPILLFINNVNASLSRDVFKIILFLVNIIGYTIMIFGILKSKNVEISEVEK